MLVKKKEKRRDYLDFNTDPQSIESFVIKVFLNGRAAAMLSLIHDGHVILLSKP